jgi:hypothetical protein
VSIFAPLPYQLTNGTTADATQVMADFNQIVVNGNSNGAASGANDDITSLSGLTTPLSVLQGGTGITDALAPLTGVLANNVGLVTANQFYDGPFIAQGTVGTWLVMGTLTVEASLNGSATGLFIKLWDGTNIVASTLYTGPSVASNVPISLSGVITSPAGNLRMSAAANVSSNAIILANGSGLGRDSIITAIRIG